MVVGGLQGNLLAGEHAAWSYRGDTGPEKWSVLSREFSACSEGRNQSPVDLVNLVDAELPALALNYEGPCVSAVNNGHTYKVEAGSGNTLMVGDRVYDLKQFHFHAPSENHIEGRSFPLECHFVHADGDGNLAVIALMFEEGSENAELEKAWSVMPVGKGEESALAAPLNPAELLPADLGYYRFSGSLTTPPCTEGVTWLVLKAYAGVSAEQVEKFQKTMGHPNNRPLQPLNARLVLE